MKGMHSMLHITLHFITYIPKYISFIILSKKNPTYYAYYAFSDKNRRDARV